MWGSQDLCVMNSCFHCSPSFFSTRKASLYSVLQLLHLHCRRHKLSWQNGFLFRCVRIFSMFVGQGHYFIWEGLLACWAMDLEDTLSCPPPPDTYTYSHKRFSHSSTFSTCYSFLTQDFSPLPCDRPQLFLNYFLTSPLSSLCPFRKLGVSASVAIIAQG
jgi:hypothetical protein